MPISNPLAPAWSRRRFLHGVGGAALGAVARSWQPNCLVAEETGDRTESLRAAVVGVGVRGKYLIGNLPESVRVAAICDCSPLRIGSTLRPSGDFVHVLARFLDRDAPHCRVYHDYRRMFEQERLDAVIIAAPDHHHVPAAVRALRASCHVYVEKPLTVTIREGRLLADAAAASGRVLQVGSQQRSMAVNRAGCEFIRDGGLGRINRVELPNYPGPLPMPDYAAESASDIQWDLFCGPAPWRPHHRHLWMKEDYEVAGLLWRGWDLFRDYSGHLMTNWGAHSVDMVQYALGRDDSGPVAVSAAAPAAIDAVGAAWSDKTPLPTGPRERRFWPVTMQYADGVELQFRNDREFIVFHGERGRLKMRRNFFETDPPELVTTPIDPDEPRRWQGAGHVARPHLENWLAAIRGQQSLHAPVEVGHRTAAICHLANLARELHRPLRWDPRAEQFVDDPAANELLDRPRRAGFEIA